MAWQNKFFAQSSSGHECMLELGNSVFDSRTGLPPMVKVEALWWVCEEQGGERHLGYQFDWLKLTIPLFLHHTCQ